MKDLLKTLFFIACLLAALTAIPGMAAPTTVPAPTAKPQHSQIVDEDWRTLDLSKTHLRGDKPFTYYTQDKPTYVRERVRLQWRPDDPIDLFIIRPKGVARPPVALFLYTYPQDTARFSHDAYCESLAAQGFAAVGFEPALSDSRFRNRPMKEWFVSEMQESLAATTHDVQLILNYLATRRDLDARSVALFGQGSGATVSILAASVDPRIKALDLIDPWADWPDWVKGAGLIPNAERPNFETPDYLARIAAFDPIKVLLTLKTSAIRLNLLKTEGDLPPVCQDKLLLATPPQAKVHQYGNVLQLMAGAGAGGSLFTWIAQQLGASPPKSARK